MSMNLESSYRRLELEPEHNLELPQRFEPLF